jgi:PAS domain S-box-containing protein
VIVLSARAGEEARIEGLEHGADDYLVKPFGARELLVRVGAMLNSASIRRAAEEAVRESESRLRLFITNAPAGIAMFDREMRYIAASRRWMEDYGLSGDLTGRSHYDVLPEMSETWRESHRRGLAGESLSSEADRFERADGSVQWVKWEIHPWRGDTGEVGGILIAAEEISARKRAEEALRRSEARYRAVVESQAEMLCRFRTDGEILFVNDAYARALGTMPDALIGQSFWDFVDGADRASMRETLERLTPEDAEARTESRFKTKDGPSFTLWTTRGLAFDSGGRVLEAQSTGIDITDRRRAEEALREADRRKDEFLATLSHELAIRWHP